MPETGGLGEGLLAILVCPVCRRKVVVKGERLECEGCGRRYAIRDGVPDMVVEESESSESRS